ncbi:MAG: hypothetical protein LZ173_09940 [Thaumarchaeota archaeon]|jgi:hypothetical protein|nr:hypothetical protein [Candidatus Geocrenenecus arthurdayi]
MENIDLKKLKEMLDKNYGEGNWRIRKVSKARKSMSIPSLTITEDLEKIGCKPNDLVIVAVQKNKITIYKI